MARPDVDKPSVSSRNRATQRRLKPPRQSVTLCERGLALRSLDLARSVRLSVLLAPAGYGKTTLLAQWWYRLRENSVLVTWYSAAGVDRDPAVFLKMLAGSLLEAGIGTGSDLERATGDAGAEVTLDNLVVALEQIDSPAVLIIDEFERVDHPPVSALLKDFLDALPDGVHLALATRVKPTMSLSLMRAQGSVRLIEANELSLSNTELSRLLGFEEDSAEVTQVAEHTEGWPVAVQLYRLWRQRVDSNRHVPRFTGRATEVADYLAEQVFSALSPEHQTLLMDLSITDYCEAGMADQIRQSHDSATLLEEISQLLPELLHQSHSAEEVAYRLHPLVAEYAQGRLQLQPGRASLLHQRAAHWLWQHERYADALCHALECGDDSTLRTMLIDLPYFEIFLRFGAGELRTMLREIPLEYRERWPRLRMMTALAHFKTGFFTQAKAMLAGIRDHTGDFHELPGESTVQEECESLALQLLFDGYILGAATIDAPLMDRIRELAPDAPLMWAWCENVSLALEQQRGNLETAQRALLRTRETYVASGIDQFGAQHLVVHELLLGLARGTLGEVSEQATAILRTPPGAQTGERVRNAMARIALAAVDYERHYHVRSADAIRLALNEFGEGEAWYDQYAIALPVIIDSVYRRHGIGAACRELDAQRSRIDRLGLTCVHSLLDALDVTLQLHAGNLTLATKKAVAAELADIANTTRPDMPWRTRGLATRAMAQLALAQGETGTASDLARRMIAEGRDGGRSGTRIKGLILLARSREQEAAPGEALEHLSEAVLIAFPDAFMAQFAEEGRALLPLLEAVAAAPQSTYEQRHVSSIIDALGSDHQFEDPNALNEREAEIVAHLADGASNKLIARRLGITDNTIKYHLKKVYAKLGVSSRKAAVARVLRDHGAS